MAYANFEEWLVVFLQKSCGFSEEDAKEIKDEITKNIEWYNNKAREESEKRFAEEMIKKVKHSKAIPTIPISPANSPVPTPWPTPHSVGLAPYVPSYTGDPLPKTTTNSSDMFYKEFHPNLKEVIKKTFVEVKEEGPKP